MVTTKMFYLFKNYKYNRLIDKKEAYESIRINMINYVGKFLLSSIRCVCNMYKRIE